ncbi:hypothetical protein CBS101457_000412 [Exobasidium rhododendri]|nr:hypothetical protein CBS101457_000412 [Exobasidium rhododendri]
MSAGRSSAKRKALSEVEDDTAGVNAFASDNKALHAQLDHFGKKKSVAREKAYKEVTEHRRQHEKNFEQCDAQFQETVSKTFLSFQETESFFNDSIIKYIKLASCNLAAVDNSFESVIQYLDARHGKKSADQLHKAINHFRSLLLGRQS